MHTIQQFSRYNNYSKYGLKFKLMTFYVINARKNY